MKVILLNPKEEIRKAVSENFVEYIKADEKAIVYAEDFFNYIYSLDEDDYYNVMASLIYDVYEILKWKLATKGYLEKEFLLLSNLENTDSLDHMIDVVLNDVYFPCFLTNVKTAADISFDDRVSTKNNMRNVNVNQTIIESDIFLKVENYQYEYKKLLFSKKYAKNEYIKLYGALARELKSKEEAFNSYVSIVYDMELYNENNYKKLILDMCKCFLLKKQNATKNATKNDKINYEEDYLIHIIKYDDIDRIFEIITDYSYLLELLVSNYIAFYKRNDAVASKSPRNNLKQENVEVFQKLNTWKPQNTAKEKRR